MLDILDPAPSEGLPRGLDTLGFWQEIPPRTSVRVDLIAPVGGNPVFFIVPNGRDDVFLVAVRSANSGNPITTPVPLSVFCGWSRAQDVRWWPQCFSSQAGWQLEVRSHAPLVYRLEGELMFKATGGASR